VAEFAQNGAIVTLHRLGGDRASAIQAELDHFARTRHIALVLPCLFEELARPPLKAIVNDLRQVSFLDRIVVSLGKTPPGGLQAAQEYFSALPQSVSIVWNDGPRVDALYRQMSREGFDAGSDGRGRAFWIAAMYALSRGDCDVIAAHDCDITTYAPELLARLCFPVVHPGFDFEFAKGYYARMRDGEMYGRVTRLFVAPLIRAVQAVVGQSPILTYLESFRYPLAGEFAMKASLARLTSVPSDCALEIGMLTETYYNCELNGICQTELIGRYDHKHQAVGDDCDSGLLKMCVDIARSLFDTLAAEGLALTTRGWRELIVSYREAATELVNRYHADAVINGLSFVRAHEDTLVAAFARALQTACERHAARRARPPLLPSWTQVTSAIPSFGEWLWEAVELDNSCSTLLPSAV
jgi:glucosyl-3-phosphoglycerate synthase